LEQRGEYVEWRWTIQPKVGLKKKFRDKAWSSENWERSRLIEKGKSGTKERTIWQNFVRFGKLRAQKLAKFNFERSKFKIWKTKNNPAVVERSEKEIFNLSQILYHTGCRKINVFQVGGLVGKNLRNLEKIKKKISGGTLQRYSPIFTLLRW
jgi:hypothetical protein